MPKTYSIIILCFCWIIAGCASQNSGTDFASASLENPLQVPLIAGSPSVHIVTKNTTQAQVDISGLLIALLQSEYDMQIANNAQSADYIIELTVDSFGKIGSQSSSASAGDVALPALSGAALGAQIGSSIDGGEGALWGVGIGAAAGVGLGMLAASGTDYIWEMIVEVNIEDKQNENFTSRIEAKAQGKDMDALEASQALENEIAWAIVRAFKKTY